MAFPPVPAYPNAIDDDYSLFLVFNTTETKICKENPPWADEIEIIPTNGSEIWANNGFGNISGELFYYDAVERNSSGKVSKLKRCARNLGGLHTRYNPPGTWVRSYVVAQHHNQLANAILNIEDFVGFNFDPRQETLDWRIRNLQALDIIFDDFSCPDVVFTFNIVEDNSTTGVLANYLVEITTVGVTGSSSFRLDFGDGQFTTTDLSGTHRYAINSSIDPVITVSNDRCQIVQTPVERNNPSQPPETTVPIFDIAFPNSPNVPDFTFVPCDIPEPEIALPPFVFPCGISLGSTGFPSVIEGPDFNLVSHVLIEATNDIQILHSVVTILGNVNIPSIVFFDVPPTIVIDPPIPPTIVIIPDSSVSMTLHAVDLPDMKIDWSTMPEMKVSLTMPRRIKRSNVNELAIAEFGDEFADLFDAQNHTTVEYEEVGIPEEIRILPPKMPKVKFDTRNFPKMIKVDTSEANIPREIKVYGPETPIPSHITISGPAKPLPTTIDVVNRDVPTSIEVFMRTSIPEKIEVQMSKEIPHRIIVETLTPIPDRIILEAIGIPNELKVVGIPDVLEVVGFPDSIPVKFPDEMPQIELVYKGGPMEFKIDLQPILGATPEGAQYPCFMAVPCPR